MHFIKVTSVLWEWREAIEPKKMVDLLHEGGSRAFQGKWSVLSSPDCAVRPNATGWGWQSGKTFQMQALAIKPFCFVNCSQGGRGLQAPTSVHKYLISSHVYGLGAALLSLGEVPSEAVTCCLVLLNNNQVFSSFFLFSFFLLKLPLLWPSAFPPHIQSLFNLCLNLVPKVSFWFWWGLIRIFASLLHISEMDSSQCQIPQGKDKDSSNASFKSGRKKKLL